MKPLYELKQEIIHKKVNSVNIFMGEEVKVMNIYISKVLGLGYDPVYCEDVIQAISMTGKKSLMKRKKCYIVYEDTSFLKDDKSWDKVFKVFSNTEDIIILKYLSLDKRGKFYKQYESSLVNFEKLSDDLLIKYVKNELPWINDRVLEELIHICKNDYTTLTLELDKITTFAKIHDMSLETAATELINNGIIHQELSNVIFEFADALVMRKEQKSLELLQIIKLKKESSPLGYISVVYKSFRNVLMVQGLGEDKSNGAARSGLDAWQYKNTLNKLNYYAVSSLIDILDLLIKLEQGIKQGTIDPEVCLDILVVQVLNQP